MSEISPYDFTGKLIGIVGEARSGKDSVADFAIEHLSHAQKLALSTPFKEFVQQLFNFTDDQLWGDRKDKPDPRYLRSDFEKTRAWVTFAEYPEHYLTPRRAMQLVMDDWARFGCCRRIITDAFFREAHALLSQATINDEPRDPSGKRVSGAVIERCRCVLVCDIRHADDAEALKETGGVIWRVTRPGVGLTGEAAKHSSEAELHSDEMSAQVDLELVNDGTLEALRGRVATACQALPAGRRSREGAVA